MSHAEKFKCSICSFPVFNRRYSKCERCGASLPEGVVYTKQELSNIQAREKNEKSAQQSKKTLDIHLLQHDLSLWHAAAWDSTDLTPEKRIP